jgi:broad specificity phosphatase PhoE
MGEPVQSLDCPNTSFWASPKILKKSMEQKWPSHLVVIRHGESERNIAKDIAKAAGKHSFDLGLRDLETQLTKRGHEQAVETGRYLSSRYKFDVIYSSPYHRTLQTAEDITSAFSNSPPLVMEERIREIEFGILDGLTGDGIQAGFPQEYERRKREGKYWYRPPGGESHPDVALRVQSFLGTLTRDYRKKSVLVVCHSVVVLIFRRLLERWNEDEYLKIDREQDVLNCSMTAYRYDAKMGKLLLDYYNKVSHLDGQ